MQSRSVATSAAEVAIDLVHRKIASHILPICILAYIVSFVDRANIGMARLQFMHDLGFSEAVFGLGAGLFFIGYMILEIPVNLVIERYGARVTLAVIMVTWGVISSAMAAVSSETEFYLSRFALGVAEAGLFPGVILYLGYWFPKAKRGRMTALFALGGPIAGVLGAPLGGWLMYALAGTWNLAGWQHLFLFEGIPAVGLGVVTLLVLPDRPAQATWLTKAEKELAIRALAEDAEDGGHRHAGFGAALRDRRVYVAIVAWIAVIAAVTVESLWTPTFLSQSGVKELRMIGLLAAVPPLVAAIAMYLVARSSDRRLERRWHFGLSLMATAVSLVLLAYAPPSISLYLLLLSIGTAGAWSATPVFWTVPHSFLRGNAAAAGIALISSTGGLGGFFAPTVVGAIVTRTGSYPVALVSVALFLAAAAAVFVAGVPGQVTQRKAGTVSTAGRLATAPKGIAE